MHLRKFNDSCITVYLQVSLKIFFEFVTRPPFLAPYISVKRWPSGKFKENFETYLKVHCYAAISTL